jgi:hypothetical protein
MANRTAIIVRGVKAIAATTLVLQLGYCEWLDEWGFWTRPDPGDTVVYGGVATTVGEPQQSLASSNTAGGKVAAGGSGGAQACTDYHSCH